MFKEISGDQYRTFLVWVEKYSNGQKDVFATIKAHFKDWLNIAVDDSVILPILDSSQPLDAFKRFLENNQVVVRMDDNQLYGLAIDGNAQVYLDDLDFILKFDSNSSYAKDAPVADSVSTDAQVTGNAHSATAITSTTDAQVTDKSLDTLTVEIKFYLNQTVQSIIEVGKRLIQAKELVPYGQWQNWLKDNFNLKRQMAQNFMEISRRFSEYQSIGKVDILSFNTTQLITLLALPEGDEQKFIEEKIAEGKAADQMTIKELRKEIAQWKKQVDDAHKESQSQLSFWKQKLEDAHSFRVDAESKLKSSIAKADSLQKQVWQLQGDKESLRDKINFLENNVPADYDALKKEVQELREKPVEVAVEKPADYETTKTENVELQKEVAELRDAQDNFKRTYDGVRKLESLFNTANSIVNSTSIFDSVKFLADKNPVAFYQNVAILRGFMTELENYLSIIQDEKKASNDAQN